MATRGENTQLQELQVDIQSLKFDNERIIKPAIVSINEKLDRDIYATKVDVKVIADKADRTDLLTKNYPIVEKVVFGLVGLVLVAVITALIALVISGGNK